MDKTCPICLKAFRGPPSGPASCSSACGGRRSGLARIGNQKRWSKASKAALGQRGQTANLKLGTAAAKASPIAGPYETNREAKVWRLLNIRTRAEYVVTNLKKFCRDNPDLFAPTPWQNAYAGIAQVQASLVGHRAEKSPVSRYKDWTLLEPAVKP